MVLGARGASAHSPTRRRTTAAQSRFGGSGASCRSSSSPPLRPENMVHQTISTSTTAACEGFKQNQTHEQRTPVAGGTRDRSNARGLQLQHATARGAAGNAERAPAHAISAPSPARSPIPRAAGLPVPWSELPGFNEDALHEGWVAMVSNCARPNAAIAPLCREVRQLALAEPDQQREWMMQRLQPFRIEALAGPARQAHQLLRAGFDATRRPTATHTVPLYQAPAGLVAKRPWYTRQEIDTLPQAQAALRGREIAWLADPIDVLMLHIQGSGRLRITEADGSQRMVRVAFAATNEQPYRSVQQWLLSQGATKVSLWPDDTKQWVAQNPQRLSQLLWSNPRYVFFREEPSTKSTRPRGRWGRRACRSRPAARSRSTATAFPTARRSGSPRRARRAAGQAGGRAGHRERHRRRGAGRLLRRHRRRCGPGRCAREPAAAAVGALAQIGLATVNVARHLVSGRLESLPEAAALRSRPGAQAGLEPRHLTPYPGATPAGPGKAGSRCFTNGPGCAGRGLAQCFDCGCAQRARWWAVAEPALPGR